MTRLISVDATNMKYIETREKLKYSESTNLHQSSSLSGEYLLSRE